MYYVLKSPDKDIVRFKCTKSKISDPNDIKELVQISVLPEPLKNLDLRSWLYFRLQNRNLNKPNETFGVLDNYAVLPENFKGEFGWAYQESYHTASGVSLYRDEFDLLNAVVPIRSPEQKVFLYIVSNRTGIYYNMKEDPGRMDSMLFAVGTGNYMRSAQIRNEILTMAKGSTQIALSAAFCAMFGISRQTLEEDSLVLIEYAQYKTTTVPTFSFVPCIFNINPDMSTAWTAKDINDVAAALMCSGKYFLDDIATAESMMSDVGSTLSVIKSMQDISRLEALFRKAGVDNPYVKATFVFIQSDRILKACADWLPKALKVEESPTVSVEQMYRKKYSFDGDWNLEVQKLRDILRIPSTLIEAEALEIIKNKYLS